MRDRDRERSRLGARGVPCGRAAGGRAGGTAATAAAALGRRREACRRSAGPGRAAGDLRGRGPGPQFGRLIRTARRVVRIVRLGVVRVRGGTTPPPHIPHCLSHCHAGGSSKCTPLKEAFEVEPSLTTGSGRPGRAELGLGLRGVGRLVGGPMGPLGDWASSQTMLHPYLTRHDAVK